MACCQNNEDDTFPCTNSTAAPVRSGTDSTVVVSRSVGTWAAAMPGSNVSMARSW